MTTRTGAVLATTSYLPSLASLYRAITCTLCPRLQNTSEGHQAGVITQQPACPGLSRRPVVLTDNCFPWLDGGIWIRKDYVASHGNAPFGA